MQWRLRIRPSRNSRELAHSSAHGWGPAVLTAGPVQIPNAQGGWQPAGQQFHVPVTDRAMPQVNGPELVTHVGQHGPPYKVCLANPELRSRC